MSLPHTLPPTWSLEERRLVDALLDEILPASEDGTLPAGSSLPVVDFLLARMADTAGLTELLRAGVRKAHELVVARGASELPALPAPERTLLVTELEKTEPEFFRAFVRQAFMGYYTQPSVPPAFGLPDRPPQPLGHKVPRDEVSELHKLLAPVLARGKHYRET